MAAFQLLAAFRATPAAVRRSPIVCGPGTRGRAASSNLFLCKARPLRETVLSNATAALPGAKAVQATDGTAALARGSAVTETASGVDGEGAATGPGQHDPARQNETPPIEPYYGLIQRADASGTGWGGNHSAPVRRRVWGPIDIAELYRLLGRNPGSLAGPPNPPLTTEINICVLEAFAHWKTFTTIEEGLSLQFGNTTALLLCDNKEVVAAFQKGGETKDHDLRLIIQRLLSLFRGRRIDVHAVYLPGKLNRLADGDSRRQTAPRRKKKKNMPAPLALPLPPLEVGEHNPWAFIAIDNSQPTKST